MNSIFGALLRNPINDTQSAVCTESRSLKVKNTVKIMCLNGEDGRLAAPPLNPDTDEGRNIIKCAENKNLYYEVSSRPKTVKHRSLVHASF